MYYIDDSGQLPELPDPGPRDGRHGVDRDEQYDPYPAERMGPGTGRGALTVSLEDATRHLAMLIARVEAGEEIVLTRHGYPVARVVPYAPETVHVSDTVLGSFVRTGAATPDGPTQVEALTAVYADYGDMPALPDPGPRDGKHGVDRDTGYEPYGQ